MSSLVINLPALISQTVISSNFLLKSNDNCFPMKHHMLYYATKIANEIYNYAEKMGKISGLADTFKDLIGTVATK